MSEQQEKPEFHIEVSYGGYKFIFSIDPYRKMSHVNVTDIRGQSITSKMVDRNAAVGGMDFYLAGVEVFIQQALKELLKERGETLPYG